MWAYYSDVAQIQDDRGRFYEKHRENRRRVAGRRLNLLTFSGRSEKVGRNCTSGEIAA